MMAIIQSSICRRQNRIRDSNRKFNSINNQTKLDPENSKVNDLGKSKILRIKLMTMGGGHYAISRDWKVDCSVH